MNIGRLNRYVRIEQQAAGQDDAGGPNGAWSLLASVWANIRYDNGAETLRADAVMGTVKASIRVRRRTDVTTAMHVVYEGVTFNILAILPDERRVFMDLACEVIR